MPYVGSNQNFGQNTGTFSQGGVSGIQDGDLIFCSVFQDEVNPLPGATCVLHGSILTAGFTALDTIVFNGAGVDLLLCLHGKVADSEPANYSLSDGASSRFWTLILTGFRWSGGAADLDTVAAFRGTEHAAIETVTPESVVVGGYTPAGSDSLAVHFIGGGIPNATDGDPSVTVDGNTVQRATILFDNGGLRQTVASEVSAGGNIPARTHSMPFGHTSVSAVGGVLIAEKILAGQADSWSLIRA